MTDYTQTRVEDYNDDPAPDNGTTVSANQITWSGIKAELFDPINTAISGVDTELDTSFASIPDPLIGKKQVYIPGMAFSDQGTNTITSGDIRVTYPTFDGSGALNEMWYPFVFPSNWDEGTVTLRLFLVADSSSTSNTVDLDISVRFPDDGDSIGGTYESVASGSYTIGSTSGDITDSGDVTLNLPTTIPASNLMVIQISRDSGDAYGPLVGLIGVLLTFNQTTVAA